jgi:hypothetical protein
MRTDELRIDPPHSEPSGPNAGTSGNVHGGNGSSGTTGADRFWGEFSRTRAGRSNPGGSGNGSGRERREGAAECLDWCPICRSADLIRGSAPPDLRGQLEAIQAEAFNVMRAFMAAYAEKAPGQGGSPDREPSDRADETDRVDIPIE